LKALLFQHTPEEHPGSLQKWLDDRRLGYHIHHTYQGLPFPDPSAYDWLIVLGGPMNVDHLEEHPWLAAERKFIGDWVMAGKPYLGICLGGQLLAQSLGGQVTRNDQREIGFHSVTRAASDHPALRRWPMNFSVFQWHEDRFSLPPGCVSLLTSPACEHQAFSRDRRTLGLQFHPESVEQWILANYKDFEPAPGESYVQSKAQCLRLMPVHLPALTQQFFHLLDDFLEGAR